MTILIVAGSCQIASKMALPIKIPTESVQQCPIPPLFPILDIGDPSVFSMLANLATVIPSEAECPSHCLCPSPDQYVGERIAL